MMDLSANTETLLFSGLFLVLCLLCCSLALIDLRWGFIPDGINLAIAGLGVTKVVVAYGVTAAVEAIIEAILVGIVFWSVRWLYFVIRKKDGLGIGDIKFLAAAVPWVGILDVPTLVLITSLAALLAIGGAHLAGQKLSWQTSLRFGPFLAIGLLSTLALQQWLGVL
jgi:leader peptidase (prepilin peptidase) / N-methyltransferase